MAANANHSNFNIGPTQRPSFNPLFMKRSRVALAASLCAAGTVLFGCPADKPSPPPPAPSAPASSNVAAPGAQTELVPSPRPAAQSSEQPVETRTLSQILAEEIAIASPMASLNSPSSHAAASANLRQLGVLNELADDNVVWGRFELATGVDPAENMVTLLPPQVWASAYLSCFSFSGKYEVRQENDFEVIEMQAAFRSNLEPGAYPVPLWFSDDEWAGYAQTTSIVFVLSDEILVGGYYRTQSLAENPTDATGAAIPKPPRRWDNLWRWQDPKKGEEPGATQMRAVLSSDNPHASQLEATYRQLDASLFSHRCVACHSPDNRARQSALVLLSHPAQSLATRHTLLSVLSDNSMPPADKKKGIPAGISDESQRQQFIKLAEEFESIAQSALDFELQKHGISPAPAPIPRIPQKAPPQ